MSIRSFLAQLKAAGLSTLPGTAAEILDDEVRAVICADKVNTAEWLDVVRTAHSLGLRTTASRLSPGTQVTRGAVTSNSAVPT
jgi:FO synthase